MRTLISYIFLASFTVVLLNACSGTTSNTVANANRTVVNTAEKALNTASNAINSVANTVSKETTPAPEDFMKSAAEGGLAEVEMGKLALAKSKDPEIKKFGQMMITDHTAANNELKVVAAKKKVTLPTDTGSHKSTIDKLNTLSGTDFDKEYVSDMVSAHETDLSAFQKEAENSTDPEVKAFAAKVEPVVQKHLDAIKAIQAKMK